MKKLFTLILALALTLSVSVGAWAEQETTTGTTPSDQATVTVKKSYKLTNAGTTSPAETFTLEQVGNGSVSKSEATSAPHLGTITGATFAEGAATTDGTSAEITINLPAYDHVGVYEYILKEVAGKTAGVTYFGNNIKLVVTVINGEDGNLRVAAVHTETEGKKSDTFVNTYSAGKLNVSKTVEGNLGDKNKYFEFTVTLTGEAKKDYGETYTVTGDPSSNENNPTSIKLGVGTKFWLKHGEKISIENLPYGVSYTVTETAADGYTTDKTGDTGTINAAEQTAAFTNTKNATIDMGVTTDSLPYIMLLGIVTLIGAAMIVKRHAFNG